MSDSFFAVIPCTVLDDPRLPGDCKLFYATLTTLSRREGYAWASNQFLSEKTGKSERTIQRWIKLLCDGGHIKADITDSNQKRRIYITINPDGAATPDKNVTHDKNVVGGVTKMSPRGDKNVVGGGDKNVTQVSIDNKSNKKEVIRERVIRHGEQKNFCSPSVFPEKKYEAEILEFPNLNSGSNPKPSPARENSSSPAPENSPEQSPDSPPKQKTPRFQAEVTQVINYLNDVTGRSLSDSSAQCKFIRARLRDGATVDQMKRIIDAKARDWLLSPKMKKYLVPKTLFNKTNFESYLEDLEFLTTTDAELERLKMPINNYLLAIGGELIWTEDENQALRKLAENIKESIRKRGSPVTDEIVLRSLQVFLQKLPEWHRTKFSIVKLNKNYNEIVNEILTSKKARGSATEWEIMRTKINERKAGRNWA